LLFFLSFWFLLLSIQEGCYQKALRIRAIVVEKGYKGGTSGVGTGSTGSRRYHWVRYRFTTPEGETKEHVDTEVLPTTWRELQEGGPVDIEYLRALADSRVAGQKASSQTFLAIALALFGAALFTRHRDRMQQRKDQESMR
jgi:hypothetical protein